MFKRATQAYGDTPQPVTPYQKAAQVWDERIGAARVQAKNWRLMAFGCLTLSFGLAGGLVWQSTQSRITPYVVEVDKLGAVTAVGPAIRPYRPTDAEIAYHLARFIADVRSLPIDPVVVRRNWLDAYGYVTAQAADVLNEYARQNNPFKSVGQKSVIADVTSVVRASDSSFQVKWTEQTYDHGTLSRTDHYTAILSIVIQQPRDADTLRRNPLGIYVRGLNWSHDITAGDTP
jgi:type IV secretion system protein VirB5